MGNFMFNCINQHDKMLFKCLRGSDKACWHCERALTVYLFKTSITKIKSAASIKMENNASARRACLISAQTQKYLLCIKSDHLQHSFLRERQKKKRQYSTKKRRNKSQLTRSSHCTRTHQTAQHKHNLIIITITDERQGPIRVAPIDAIK